MLPKINPIHYVLLAIIFVSIKFLYTQLTVNDLTFIIGPVRLIITLFTKAQSTFLHNQGYYFAELKIIIDRSCSGFTLWIISFLSMSLLSIKHAISTKARLVGFGIAIILSYLFTILANSSRILTLILLQDLAKINWIHEGTGVLINLTFLIITYMSLDITLTRKQHS